MANIIRIRLLDLEQNLNQSIVIPVDSDSYGINAKKISIYDLKSWILSGFTGGGNNTSCTGITSNVIRIIVTGSTTTTTTTLPVTTTTTTLTPTISYLYFNPLATTGALAVNNPLGRTFNITINYEVVASCENFNSGGIYPNFATTIFQISTNGGSSWFSPPNNTASASVSGGSPTPQIDTVTVNGTTTINNVTNISNVIMGGTIPCSLSQEVYGSIKVTLINAAVAGSGSASIICNDIWTKYCGLGTLVSTVSCTTTPLVTTTTTTHILYGPFTQYYANNPVTLCSHPDGIVSNIYSYVNSSILVNGRTYYNSNGTTYIDNLDAAYSSGTGIGIQYGIFDNNGVWIVTGTC